MAERIVSPGVFTRERDLSFLPQAIGEIGAAIIGPTKMGPAFTPTQVTNFQEFEEMFGGVDARFYTPYAVEEYLRSAGVVTMADADTPTASLSDGALAVDTSGDKLYFRSGGAWILAGGSGATSEVSSIKADGGTSAAWVRYYVTADGGSSSTYPYA